MPNYSVAMGQGVAVRNLRGNMLLTGYDQEDTLLSCSAVVFVNTRDWSAGLYHFPEGSINEDERSQVILRAMASAVGPTEAYIGWGTFGIVDNGFYTNDFNQRVQLAHGEELRSFVLRLLPSGSRLRRIPAKTGLITVTTNAGATVIGRMAPDDCWDLRRDEEGNHGIYVTYGDAHWALEGVRAERR
jgi:hypothetical protein